MLEISFVSVNSTYGLDIGLKQVISWKVSFLPTFSTCSHLLYRYTTQKLVGCLFVCFFLTMDMCHKTSYCRNPPYVMKLEMTATRTCFQQTNSNLWAVLLVQQCWCSKETMPITALFQSIKTDWKLSVCLVSKIQPLWRLDLLLPEVPTQDCTSLLTNNSFFLFRAMFAKLQKPVWFPGITANFHKYKT